MQIPKNQGFRYTTSRNLRKALRQKRIRIAALFGLALVAGFSSFAALTTFQAHAYTANAFVMVVKTDNSGTSNSTSFTIPTTGAGYSYNVDCNDDGVNEVTARTTAYTCVYGSAGTYTVAITGTFHRIYFNNGGDRQKLLEVKQWGTNAWTSMAYAFYGCNNVHVTATDAPILTGSPNLSGMFYGASNLNENINHWNTSTVTNFNSMFSGATNFNQPLDDWDTGSVTNMSSMFDIAQAFNQPLNNWDTSSVTNMSGMFTNAQAFNQPLNNWDTSSVTNMSRMFTGANAFNQPLNNWDTSSVTNMSGMFVFVNSFNYPLDNWDTSSVTTMETMFTGATEFNQPLNMWDISSVTNMRSMFSSASAFNQPLDDWDTSSVTTMENMFSSASAFNQPLDNWDISDVTNMINMLSYSGITQSNYDQILAGWASRPVQPNVTLNIPGVRYCDAAAHDVLTSPPNNWTIYDGGLCAPTVTTPTDGQLFTTFTPEITGSSPPNRFIRITIDGAVFTTTAASDGSYSYQIPTELTYGYHTLIAQTLDQNGNPGASTQVSFAVQNSPTVSSPVDQSVISNRTPNIEGSAVPNRTVHIDVDGASYTTLSDAYGTFSFTIPSPLSDGWYVAKVSSSDSAGTAGDPTTISFKVSVVGNISLTGNSAQPTLSWLATPLPSEWSQTATGSTSFPARGSFEIASFNGKLWVLGGQGLVGNARLNDIWSTTDGITWTQEVANAAWSDRNAHQVVVFNDKIWVLGGQGNGGRLNDVWSSPDGVTWTEETVAANWVARVSHQVVVHNNIMWVVGGVDQADTDLTDVWSSSDGVTWTQETAAANWPSRRGFALTSFINKLWVMGGLINNWDVFENDVWSSTDGITWVEETADAAWQIRASHQAEVYDGKMWILGGSGDNWNSEYSDVWSTADGVNWVRETQTPGWEARRGHATAVHDNMLWVMGGRVGQDWVLSNDVWNNTTPGVTYTICWDQTEGGCANTAETELLSYAISQVLGAGTWYFSITATANNGGQVLGSYSSSYEVSASPTATNTSASSGSQLANTGMSMWTLIIAAGATIVFAVGILVLSQRRLYK